MESAADSESDDPFEHSEDAEGESPEEEAKESPEEEKAEDADMSTTLGEASIEQLHAALARKEKEEGMGADDLFSEK